MREGERVAGLPVVFAALAVAASAWAARVEPAAAAWLGADACGFALGDRAFVATPFGAVILGHCAPCWIAAAAAAGAITASLARALRLRGGAAAPISLALRLEAGA